MFAFSPQKGMKGLPLTSVGSVSIAWTYCLFCLWILCHLSCWCELVSQYHEANSLPASQGLHEVGMGGSLWSLPDDRHYRNEKQNAVSDLPVLFSERMMSSYITGYLSSSVAFYRSAFEWKWHRKLFFWSSSCTGCLRSIIAKALTIPLSHCLYL